MEDNNIVIEPLSTEAAKETIRILKELISKLKEEKDLIQANEFKLEGDIATLREEYKIKLMELEKKNNTLTMELQAIRNMMPEMKAFKDSGTTINSETLKPLDSISLGE